MEVEELIHSKKRELSGKDFTTLIATFKKVSHVRVIDKVHITSDKLNQKNIEIVNCDFEDEAIFKTGDAINSLILVNCCFKKRMLLFESSIKRVKFIRTTFEQYLSFKLLSTETLNIEKCLIKNIRELILNEFETIEFTFKNNDTENDIYLKPINIKKLVIEGSEKSGQITFSQLESKNILEEVYIFVFSNQRTDLLLRNFNTKKFQIVGELKDALLFINNVKVGTGILDYFFNEGNLKISTIQPLSDKSLLIIKNSSVGKAQINNCNFANFGKIILGSSSLIEIIPINITWCSSRNLISDNEKELKENYRQLKLVASKNEDIHNKLVFEKHEMHSLLKIIKISKGKFIDKAILYTSFYSNDFGLNWLKALSWLIGSSILWYTTIKYLINQREYDSSLIIDEIGKFLIFINPIHQFDKIFGVDPALNFTNGGIFIDGVSRIIGAYLIFQFISAFRKYSKK